MKEMFKTITNTDKRVGAMRSSSMDRVSSVSADGRDINVEAHSNSELRELSSMMPYGISSSPPNGLPVQIIYNHNGNDATVGVNDPDRPSVKQGELVLYTPFGQTIEFRSDGNIYIKASKGEVVIQDGTNGIARVGDEITVNVPTIGECKGTITKGSEKVKCG